MRKHMGRNRAKAREGKVFTPYTIAIHMVNKLFKGQTLSSISRVLDAGCGTGVFIEAIIEWCRRRDIALPEIIGVEIDPLLVKIAQGKFDNISRVKIVHGDFLTISGEELGGKFDYIISNPPYISYEKIDLSKREMYRRLFKVATGRFDTYMLFFEKALELLKPGGRLVFITPEKYLYVISAKSLRKLLAKYHIEEIELIHEDLFRGVLAYPAITVLVKKPPAKTIIKMRDGMVIEVILPRDGSPWFARVQSHRIPAILLQTKYKLKDITLRISPGIATGRDNIFIIPRSNLPKELERFSYPTISGNELSTFKPGDIIDYNKLRYVMLVPYDIEGKLLTEEEVKPLISYLQKWKHILEARYVVKRGKKVWYAFHEDPPLRVLLKPKILWQDIARIPAFYIDIKGLIIPRHSVYYLVPKNPDIIPDLVKYLNSDEVKEWLKTHCQKAANGYIRLQSHVLKELPIPEEFFLKSITQNKRGLERWLQTKR